LLGPGLITGASDDDPSGIGTYSTICLCKNCFGYCRCALPFYVSKNKKIMGKRVNGRFTNFVGWTAAIVMFAATIGMFATWR